MNEKIQNMIKELAYECHENEVSLLLSTIDKEGEASYVEVGRSAEIAINYLNIEEQFKKNTRNSKCNCPGCQFAREVAKTPKLKRSTKRPDIIFEGIVNAEELSAIIEKVFGGRKNDDN